ncbi:MAG TPA: hypothetical protein VMQ86_19230 [Bryobacteraceae bacterium]|jgi:hypothetical protein|nr:hypothetical protein [Bryobacteraceae bacterium]
MKQEPQKPILAEAAIPESQSSPGRSGQAPADEPEQVIRPEDEALVVERLRDLGYIE